MPSDNSPCPEPRPKASSSRAPWPGANASASSACPRTSEPCGVRTGADTMTNASVNPSTVVDRLGRAHRRTRGKGGVPARGAGMGLAPVFVRKSEIEIGQRAADRDVSDAEGRGGERLGLPVERTQHDLLFCGVGGK